MVGFAITHEDAGDHFCQITPLVETLSIPVLATPFIRPFFRPKPA
jgi:hypothetical protein